MPLHIYEQLTQGLAPLVFPVPTWGFELYPVLPPRRKRVVYNKIFYEQFDPGIIELVIPPIGEEQVIMGFRRPLYAGRGILSDVEAITELITWINFDECAWLYTAGRFGVVDFELEVCHRAVYGHSRVRLFDQTDSVEVVGSQMATGSTSFVRQRSVALTLIDGHEYMVQYGRTVTDDNERRFARLLIS